MSGLCKIHTDRHEEDCKYCGEAGIDLAIEQLKMFRSASKFISIRELLINSGADGVEVEKTKDGLLSEDEVKEFSVLLDCTVRAAVNQFKTGQLLNLMTSGTKEYYAVKAGQDIGRELRNRILKEFEI